MSEGQRAAAAAALGVMVMMRSAGLLRLASSGGLRAARGLAGGGGMDLRGHRGR